MKKYDICKKEGIRLIRIKENVQCSDKEVSDITLYVGASFNELIDKLRYYIQMPDNINIVKDAKAIKEQYYYF